MKKTKVVKKVPNFRETKIKDIKNVSNFQAWV